MIPFAGRVREYHGDGVTNERMMCDEGCGRLMGAETYGKVMGVEKVEGAEGSRGVTGKGVDGIERFRVRGYG